MLQRQTSAADIVAAACSTSHVEEEAGKLSQSAAADMEGETRRTGDVYICGHTSHHQQPPCVCVCVCGPAVIQAAVCSGSEPGPRRKPLWQPNTQRRPASPRNHDCLATNILTDETPARQLTASGSEYKSAFTFQR